MIRKFLGRMFRVNGPRGCPAAMQEGKVSYSQCAEDLLADRILQRLGISVPRYLDVGANYPVKLNNTFRFYANGGSGVLVEPNPILCQQLRDVRPRDVVLNCGVRFDEREEADFHIMTNPFLSTFSKAAADEMATSGENRIERIIRISLVCIHRIIEEHLPDGPNFLSLDTEGVDFQILKGFDFANYRPEVLCLETIVDSRKPTERKRTDIIQYARQHGYMVYGDTYVNTIFVDEKKWRNR